MISVSDVVAAKAREVGATEWLDTLGDLVQHAANAWQIDLGPELPGGTEAYVCEATRADGTPAVLKMMLPRPHEDGLGGRAAELEATILRVAGGRGCAELFESDDSIGALLMERLGPSLFALGAPLEHQHQIMVGCAQALWRSAADIEAELPTGADKARWLIDAVSRQWERLDRPCAERTVIHAIAAAERRLVAHDAERARLVHGDIHQWNTLATLDRTGYKLIDPDGLFAEPEYDLGILMREDPVELMAGDPFDRARKLASLTDLDVDINAIWEWGVIERLSTGLLCVSIWLEPVGAQMLDAADRIATI